MSFYTTIEQEGMAEYKDRGSKFLAYVFPFSAKTALKNHLAFLKKEHPKAAHFCFAYRIGTDGNNFRSADDGEPAGSAGKPILGQIDSKGLTDLLVIVVRYFGGTLLGVPGLINAYKSVTSLVLQVIPSVQKPILIFMNIQFDYTQMNDIILLLKQTGSTVISLENQLFPAIRAGVPVDRKDEVMFKLKNLRNVEISTIL